jgi:hypothetical protein
MLKDWAGFCRFNRCQNLGCFYHQAVTKPWMFLTLRRPNIQGLKKQRYSKNIQGLNNNPSI